MIKTITDFFLHVLPNLEMQRRIVRGNPNLYQRCLQCGKWGHNYLSWMAPIVPRCKNCGAANVMTRDCPCDNPYNFNGTERLQTLRRVGNFLYKSVRVLGNTYEAVFNTALEITEVSVEFYKTLQLFGYEQTGNRITVPMEVDKKVYIHECVINTNLLQDIAIGLDLLDQIGFSITVGQQSINCYSPKFSDPYEIRAIPIREIFGEPPNNAMLQAVHAHNRERLRNIKEREALPDFSRRWTI